MTKSRSLIVSTLLFALVCGFGLLAKTLLSRTNSIGMKMVKIPSGSFTMGSPTNESGRDDDEIQHRVTLSRSFFISAHEVTQSQYKKVMGKNPSHFLSCGGSCPVEKVAWFEAMMFANRLSDQEGLSRCYSGSGNNIRWNRSCTGYRLPTEAEWEYAARGGEDWVYPGSFDAGDVAWLYANSGKKTHPVGTKQPNAWGLYDMGGNVWEWVWDWYGGYSGDARDPTGPSSGYRRVLRGGSWYSSGDQVRVAAFDYLRPDYTNFDVGFRLARSLNDTSSPEASGSDASESTDACKLKAAIKLPDCKTFYGATCSFESITRAGCGTAQAENAILKELCESGSIASAAEIETGMVCQSGEALRVNLSAVEVDGSLDQGKVTELAKREQKWIQACYEHELSEWRRDPSRRPLPRNEDEFIIEAVVSESGKVDDALVKGNYFMNDCVEREVMRWLFPAPKAAATILISFIFEPSPRINTDGSSDDSSDGGKNLNAKSNDRTVDGATNGTSSPETGSPNDARDGRRPPYRRGFLSPVVGGSSDACKLAASAESEVMLSKAIMCMDREVWGCSFEERAFIRTFCNKALAQQALLESLCESGSTASEAEIKEGMVCKLDKD